MSTLTPLCVLRRYRCCVASEAPFAPRWRRTLFPSRPQLSTGQHHHIRRSQHRHAHRQRIHWHPPSAQRTSCRGDCVHQRPSPLLHPEPHRCWHSTASVHRSPAIHRWDAVHTCLPNKCRYSDWLLEQHQTGFDYTWHACVIHIKHPWHRSLWDACIYSPASLPSLLSLPTPPSASPQQSTPPPRWLPLARHCPNLPRSSSSSSREKVRVREHYYFYTSHSV